MIPLKDNLSCKVFPIATLILIALNILGFGIELAQGENINQFLMHWAVVPSSISAAFGTGSILAMGAAMLTVLTAMFLHGGWMHLIGNMVFFQAFGRSVEARMGTVKFALFYLLGGFAAWGLHMMTDPTSPVPALGASGAIAAVLGAYLVFYPKAKFKTLFMMGPLPILAITPAWWLLLAWFTLQLMSGIGGILQVAGGGGVAYWAHIGGFLFGVICAGAWGLIKPVSNVCYTPISCGCECGNKNGACACKQQKVRVVKFWQKAA